MLSSGCVNPLTEQSPWRIDRHHGHHLCFLLDGIVVLGAESVRGADCNTRDYRKCHHESVRVTLLGCQVQPDRLSFRLACSDFHPFQRVRHLYNFSVTICQLVEHVLLCCLCHCKCFACLPSFSLFLSLVHSVLFSPQVRRAGTSMKIRTCTSLFGRRIDIPPFLGLDSSLRRIILTAPCLERTSPS